MAHFFKKRQILILTVMCWQNSPFMQCPNVANTLRDGPLYNTDFFVIGELNKSYFR